MRRLLPDTVVARSVAILIAALLAVQVIGYVAYRAGVALVAERAQDRALAERIVSIKRAIAAIPDEGERDKTAHALSSASLEVHWSRVSLVLSPTPLTARAAATAASLRDLASDLEAQSFRIAFADDGTTGNGEADRHLLLVSVRLDDQSFVNFSAARFGTVSALDPRLLALAAGLGLVIVLVAGLLLRRVTRPLSELAQAAERFSLDTKPKQLAEHGPQEVRRAAKAFNTMRGRIQSLVGERTQALAAVSHDLRTPITRVRLRSEAIDDPSTRSSINADLQEMELMIEQTLEFLRVGDSGETNRLIDLASIVQTLVTDAQDAGQKASFSGLGSLTVMGQPLALKRAIGNLIGNGLKYGTQVEVVAKASDGKAEITIRDDGPGISPDRIESAFGPFVRLEESRNSATGGVGLGLTIARSIFRAHGGDVVLINLATGGLSALVTLPMHDPPASRVSDAQSSAAMAKRGQIR
jgi:signal transduction histidine kinase